MDASTNHAAPLWRRGLYFIVPALLSLVIYIPSITNDFVWDAKGVFVHDPSIRSMGNIPRFFTEPSTLPSYLEDPGRLIIYLQYYRPVMKTIHSLEFRLFQDHPLGYNIVNIVLNAVVVVLVLLLVSSVTGSRTLAFLSALLYAVNPSRVEAVSWTYSDSYLFAATFMLLSLHLYRKGYYGGSLSLFAVSLLTHETAAVFPCIVLAYEYLIQGKHRLRELVNPAFFFLLLGVFLAVRRSIVGSTPLTNLDIPSLFNSLAVIIKRYVKLTFIPDAPATVYIYKPGMFSIVSPEVMVSYVVLAGLTAFGVFLWFRNKRYLFWYLWFFLLCAISFNVGQYGEYLMAEKLLYLASVGMCVLVALPAATARRGRVVFLMLYACLFIYHLGTTVDRQRYYKSTQIYLRQIVSFAPDFTLGRLALALEYEERLDYDRALSELRRSLVMQPALLPLIRIRTANIHYLKGLSLSTNKDYESALKEYRSALAWKPDHAPSYNNMGNIYLLQGDRRKALEAWRMSIELDPSNGPAHYNVASEYHRQGKIREALRYYQRYLDVDPAPQPNVKYLMEQLQKRPLR